MSKVSRLFYSVYFQLAESP